MIIRKIVSLSIIIGLVLLLFFSCSPADEGKADVIIYGGTSAAVISAVEIARLVFLAFY